MPNLGSLRLFLFSYFHHSTIEKPHQKNPLSVYLLTSLHSFSNQLITTSSIRFVSSKPLPFRVYPFQPLIQIIQCTTEHSKHNNNNK